MDEIDKVFEGLDLSEDFKSKIKTVLEQRVESEKQAINDSFDARVEERAETLANEYKNYVQDEMKEEAERYIQEEVMPTVQRYVDFAAKEFAEENRPVVESEVKVEMADKFLSGITEASKEYNVTIPEGQDDYVKQMEEKLESANKRFDDTLKEKEQLQNEIVESKRSSIIETKSEGLAETQKEKLATVAENVSFHDEDQFGNAIARLRQEYFPESNNESQNKGGSEAGSMNEDVDTFGTRQTSKQAKTGSWLDDI